MDEFDNFGSVVVQMSLIVVIKSDLAFPVLQLANVNTSRLSVLLQEVDQVREVVSQVLRLFQLAEEVFLVLLFFVVSYLGVFLLALGDFDARGMSLFLVGNQLELLLSLDWWGDVRHMLQQASVTEITYLAILSLLLSVVEEVLSEILLRLHRFGLECL